jgi:hypothetical protein
MLVRYFSVSFDESLKKVSQKGQMDIVIRFWNNASDEVSTRYLTSTFLEHARADDILRAFTSSLAGLGIDVKKMLERLNGWTKC